MIGLPRPALVVLIGPSGAGKTTWASRSAAPVMVCTSITSGIDAR
jgi:predicted kinase